MTSHPLSRMFWNGELSRIWLIMFLWSLTTGMFATLPFWVTHAIWFWSSIWLLVDSFTLLNDLDTANKALAKAREGLDVQTAERLDCLERHIKAYVLCSDMRYALTERPKKSISRSHSEGPR
jgi:hypothetical protein